MILCAHSDENHSSLYTTIRIFLNLFLFRWEWEWEGIGITFPKEIGTGLESKISQGREYEWERSYGNGREWQGNGYAKVIPAQHTQEAQLSQRGRAMLDVIEYFAKSLKVIRNDTLH